MNRLPHHLAGAFLRRTGLCYWPVRVKSGVAAGARWTLYPWSSYWRGGFEEELQRELLGLGDISGWCCWDLGAHYGLYSIGLARRTGPSGQVVSFEPNPLSYARLERHRRMNALTWLKPFDSAVSDAPGTAELYTYGDLESTTTHLPYEGETPGAQCAPVSVRVLRLDDLVAGGGIRAPHFIKIDVEGHAHKALAGARATLAANRPIVIVAFHSDLEANGVHAILDALGYSATRISTHSGSNDSVIGHDFIFRPSRQPGPTPPASSAPRA
jgi:FkbM family methyltransferase